MTEEIEETVELRDYQLELFHEIEKRRSSILYLPTGSGKTHIAFWLIKSMVRDLKRPVAEGGKRTFFLVNTKQLVEQQAALLIKLGNFKVVCLSGDAGVDNFNSDHWYALEKEKEVFVMTAQVYLNALSSSFLSIENANLLVFDECHRATGQHVMAQIMNLVNSCKEDKKPKILGLSATLLNANVKKEDDFEKGLKMLETIFDGEIISAKNCVEIGTRFSAKPNVNISEKLSKYKVPESVLKVLQNLSNQCSKMLNTVALKDNTVLDAEEQKEIQLHKPGQNRSKLLRNSLTDILIHVNEYGLFMGFICCQCYVIQLYRYLFVSCEQRYIDFMLYTINLAQLMRKELYSSILQYANCGDSDLKTPETILRTSSGKIAFLFDHLGQLKSEDRCIIFVTRKTTAKSLYHILKIFTEKFPDSKATVDFMVGSDSNPLRNTKEGIYDNKKQKEILKRFRDGLINVLIATDVLEEGIDVQQCNIVIMFDRITTFRSYVQSKGRARMKGSQYIILTDAKQSVTTQIQKFQNIDSWLDRVVREKNMLDDDDDSTSDTELESYKTSTGAIATNVSAVSKIYQYCSILPRDLFTDLIPYWFYNPQSRRCRLRLPVNSGIRLNIRGPARSSQKSAKQAVALEVVKQLHQLNLLDDCLLPIRIPKEVLDSDYWFPNWDVEDAEKQKRIKLKLEEGHVLDNTMMSPLKVPSFLERSRPRPFTECYLHVIKTKPEYKMPTLQRHVFCHELMLINDYNFGILTHERLPQICEFPTYSDLGEVRVTIEVNARVLTFGEKQLEDISKFHRSLFIDILQVVPKCFVFDTYEESNNGYYVVPLTPNKKTGALTELSWKCIRTKVEVDITKPSEEEILNQEYNFDNYICSVVTPWYKPTLRFIVCDILKEMSMFSEFNDNKFSTYAEYFSKKYNLTALRPDQPLLHVRPITTNFDGIIPRPISKSQKNRQRNKDNDTNLPPEFCHVYSFPCIFWYKAIILPSVLHRMYHLLLAEDLRRKIANEAGVGSLQIPLSEEDTVPYFRVVTKITVENDDTASSAVARKPSKRVGRDLSQKQEKVVNEIKIEDINREIDAISLEEIEAYAKYVDSPLVSSRIINKVQDEGSIFLDNVLEQRAEKYVIKFVASPQLMTLNDYEAEYGPKPHQILEALTLRNAADAFNLERLETLGDSLLKYLVCVSLFIECGHLNEGHLSLLKGRLVSNQNLYYCAKKMDIAPYIKAVVFSAKTFWSPPGFSIPSVLKNHFDGPLSALLAANIPYGERFSGNVSVETIDRVIETDIPKYIQQCNKPKENSQDTKEKLKQRNEIQEKRTHFYLGKQELRRKNISDVMEALLGSYLETCGMRSTFKLLKYIGIPSKATTLEEMYRNIQLPISSPDFAVCSLERLLPEHKSIENLLNYEFNNKYYLLQAFTHPSYSANYVTDCYQKLEFIGDAILDFLITSYIYQYCDNLNPGELTDLRSSLVNNNTFGALVVRLQLHRHLLYHSRRLTDAMEAFVSFQHSKNFEIHGNELVRLISENDTMVAEEVDVPKALGDIFESLAGAIFLDSGCNLLAVWNVYYSIMKDEIDKFSERIPINPVRALYEKVGSKTSARISFATVKSTLPGGMEQFKAKSKVMLRITLNKQTKEYMGKGDTTKTAKRAAAKFALRDLHYDEFVI